MQEKRIQPARAESWGLGPRRKRARHSRKATEANRSGNRCARSQAWCSEMRRRTYTDELAQGYCVSRPCGRTRGLQRAECPWNNGRSRSKRPTNSRISHLPGRPPTTRLAHTKTSAPPAAARPCALAASFHRNTVRRSGRGWAEKLPPVKASLPRCFTFWGSPPSAPK